MPKLTFDEETHEYFVEETRIPGVSEILKECGLTDFGSIPQEILDYAASRGKAVHKACEIYDAGLEFEQPLQDIIQPYFDAWVEFCDEYKPEWVMIETPAFSPEYGYAGTLDRVAVINNTLWVLDIKSGAKRPVHAIQVAAYKELIPENALIRRGCVYLDPKKKKTKYKLVEYSDEQDIFVWLSALTIYKFKKGGIDDAVLTSGFISPSSLNAKLG